jgi:hypothetical protein
LAGDLLQLDHHEFGGLERRKAHHDIDDAQINVMRLDETGSA